MSMVFKNRLAEIKPEEDPPEKGVEEEAPLQATKASDIGEHMKEYEPIKKGLELIQKNVEEITRLADKDRTITAENKRKSTMAALDKIMGETTQMAAQLKANLDGIHKKDEEYKEAHKNETAKIQMRTNLYQTHIRRFHQVMNDYNTAATEFKQGLQQRTRRQIKIVDNKLTDSEVDQIVASGQAQGVIAQALISDNLQDVVRDIEARHLEILKLEQQVQEVYELFRDLASLVDLQQESLDVIEARVEHAKSYVQEAEVQLQQAAVYQRKTRKRTCCLMFILLAILAAILIPSLATSLRRS